MLGLDLGVFDAASIGIIRGSGERIVDANDEFLAMVGHDRAELQAGALNWRTMTPPEFAHLDDAGIRQAVSSGGFTVPYEQQ